MRWKENRIWTVHNLFSPNKYDNNNSEIKFVTFNFHMRWHWCDYGEKKVHQIQYKGSNFYEKEGTINEQERPFSVFYDKIVIIFPFHL